MMTLVFIIFMIIIFGKIGWLAVKAAWGITKILFTLVLLPVVLIVLAASGLVVVALPVLIVIGIISLFAKAVF